MTNEERLRGEVSALRKALEFYADAVSYATKYMQHGLATEAAPVVLDHHGDIARRALTTDFGKPETEVIAAAERFHEADRAYRTLHVDILTETRLAQEWKTAKSEFHQAFERMEDDRKKVT